MIDSTVQEHTGDNAVILMCIENRPPGKTALVDPGVLPAKNTEKIRFQKDQYIDQDQCCCGLVKITAYAAFGRRTLPGSLELLIWFHIDQLPFIICPIVAGNDAKVK